MVHSSTSPWSRAARGMSRRVAAAMEHMADVIKDALLDGPRLGDDEDEPAGPLPRLSPQEFVERMRPQVEEALRRVAEAVNAAPAGALRPSGAEETGDLFNELWLEALRTAVLMRLEAEAVEDRVTTVPEPQGEWARRYRRMHIDEDPR